jgi:hypothetical protein
LKFFLTDIPTDIVFENSYVDRLIVEPYTITLLALFHLPSNHPLYEAPGPNEWGCFRQGRLTIVDFKKFSWEATGRGPATDADGTKSWDFDYFNKEGDIWVLGGEWGEIEVAGDKLGVSIEWEESPSPVKKNKL